MVAPLGRRTVKGVRHLTLFKHGALTKRKVRVVQEGVGLNRLQTLFYYLKLPPLHIIPCWPDCIPSFWIKWPPLCGRVWGCCKLDLCASYRPCSHDFNSNCLKMS
jgi:hypothetical protein